MSELYLTPTSATILLVAAVISGYRYRRTWKTGAPRWQMWLFGAIAALCFVALGFVPVKI